MCKHIINNLKQLEEIYMVMILYVHDKYLTSQTDRVNERHCSWGISETCQPPPPPTQIILLYFHTALRHTDY